jgi:hypothetical protein
MPLNNTRKRFAFKILDTRDQFYKTFLSFVGNINGATTFSKMTFRIMTLSKIFLIVTLSINDTA